MTDWTPAGLISNSELSRRDLLKAGAGGAAILTAGGVLSACGSGSSPEKGIPPVTTGPSSTGKPSRGGSLRVGLLTNGQAETIDVRKAANFPDYSRTDNLYDPLFFTVADGTAPGLATSAEPNSDASVWTIKLRDGVHWHDGKPFTADDVVYTIKTWSTPDSFFQPLAASIFDFKGVRKRDSKTVEVPLIKPVASLPAVLSFYNGYIVQDGTTNFNKPVGTGPFRLEKFVAGVSSTFSANDDYWSGRPYVDELVIDSSFTDDQSRVNALLNGQIDIAPAIPSALAKTNADSGGLVLGNSPGSAFVAVTMRINKPPFNDPRVVQAFKLFTERKPFVTNVFNGYATAGNDCPGAGLEYWASDIKPEYDPDKARSLLKAAGQENLTLPLLTSETLPGMNASSALWAEQAGRAGVTAKIKQFPPSSYYTSANPGYFTDQRPLSTNFWITYPPALGVFYLLTLNSGAVVPETAWGQAPGQDKLFNDALGETNPTKAKAKWHAVQEQQVREGGYIIVANFNFLDAYGTNVRGVKTDPAGPNANYTYDKGWLAA